MIESRLLKPCAVLLLVASVACGRSRPPAEGPYALPVTVFADTGRGGPLRVSVPPAAAHERVSVWLARVSPVRPAPLDVPLPEAVADTLASAWPAPPELAVDEGLKPPIPRLRAPLAMPARAPRGVVELDVRVDEKGGVSDALWANGSEDSALVRAAIDCALAMRFYPALRAGRPVAVWCRQRFDFAGAQPGSGRDQMERVRTTSNPSER